MLIVDTREKWTQPGSKDRHIRSYFDRHGIAYTVKKLDVGDYMLDGGRVTIDRKASIDEISGNLTNPADKRRFWNEARLARKMGIRLIVLIESNKYKAPKDLQRWRSKYSRVPGSAVVYQMQRLHNAYGVDFLFCPKMSVARRICEILEENNGG